MSEYRLSPRALRDLEDIAGYTLRRWGAEQMADYLRGLADRFQWLAENPSLGRPRDDVHKGYRCYTQSSHLIFYLVRETRIDIIGLPHKAMDVESFFRT